MIIINGTQKRNTFMYCSLAHIQNLKRLCSNQRNKRIITYIKYDYDEHYTKTFTSEKENTNVLVT